MKKDLSIIIVNYNTKKLLLECLDSIQKCTTGLVYEVIIVDNASDDGSVVSIHKINHKRRNKIKVIANKHNLGFTGANNQGLKEAKGEFLLLLNSDTLILDNVLKNMVDWMRDNQKVGISSCSLSNKDGSYQPSGGWFPSILKVFAWMFFLEDIPFLDRLIKPFHPHYQKKTKSTIFQDWVTGAFFMIRRAVVEEVGYLDEDYFMYVEEVDYCFRAKKYGWKVALVPQGQIIHYGGGSSGGEFTLHSELKNIKLFYQKNYPKIIYPLLLLFLKLGSLFRAVLYSVFDFKKAKIYAKAFYQI